MARSANHYTVSGHGIEGVVDTAGLTGSLAISLEVDGRRIEDVRMDVSDVGIEVTALVDAIPDLQTVLLRLALPQVNVGEQGAPFAGFAVLVTARTSIGGPAMVDGAIQSYDLRPVGGIASATES